MSWYAKRYLCILNIPLNYEHYSYMNVYSYTEPSKVAVLPPPPYSLYI